jgi:hypothetical protein
MATNGTSIFVSYAHADRPFAERLVADLKKAGAQVWYDVTGIDEGNFISEINEALSNCEWCVLTLTPHAIMSKWVNDEVNAALNRRKQGFIRGVLPILAAPCAPRSIPPLWDTLQRYDATSNYEAALTDILHVLGISPHIQSPPVAAALVASGELPGDNWGLMAVVIGAGLIVLELLAGVITWFAPWGFNVAIGGLAVVFFLALVGITRPSRRGVAVCGLLLGFVGIALYVLFLSLSAGR